MDFDSLIRTRTFALCEASIFERVRRDPALTFDANIAHAALLYSDRGARALAQVHNEYWDIARFHGAPILALTDTWRASASRIARSAWAGRMVNEDNVRFLRDLRGSRDVGDTGIFIGGHLGPMGDAYQPGQAPGREQAVRHHAPQVTALASAGADFLQASTLPAVPEAMGIADAASQTGLPYVLSFVVRPDGCVLDGTPLGRAIDSIDDQVTRAPAGYAINCAHPAAVASALRYLDSRHVARMVALQVNASSRSPEELDGLEWLDTGDPDELAATVWDIALRYRIPWLGGCCGTDGRYLARLAQHVAAV